MLQDKSQDTGESENDLKNESTEPRIFQAGDTVSVVKGQFKGDIGIICRVIGDLALLTSKTCPSKRVNIQCSSLKACSKNKLPSLRKVSDAVVWEVERERDDDTCTRYGILRTENQFLKFKSEPNSCQIYKFDKLEVFVNKEWANYPTLLEINVTSETRLLGKVYKQEGMKYTIEQEKAAGRRATDFTFMEGNKTPWNPDVMPPLGFSVFFSSKKRGDAERITIIKPHIKMIFQPGMIVGHIEAQACHGPSQALEKWGIVKNSAGMKLRFSVNQIQPEVNVVGQKVTYFICHDLVENCVVAHSLQAARLVFTAPPLPKLKTNLENWVEWTHAPRLCDKYQRHGGLPWATNDSWTVLQPLEYNADKPGEDRQNDELVVPDLGSSSQAAGGSVAGSTGTSKGDAEPSQ